MAPRHKYPAIKLRRNDYELDERLPGERRIINDGTVKVNQLVFKKNRIEKEILKAAKLEWKRDQVMKISGVLKSRPGQSEFA
jgi:hypothetical protein